MYICCKIQIPNKSLVLVAQPAASNADQLAYGTGTAGTYSQNFGGGLSDRLSYGSSGNPYEQNFQQTKNGFYLRG